MSKVTQGSSTVYSAQYGSQGSMYCRAASSSTTCQGSTYTGAYLHYDAQGQMIAWQNTWSNPTATAAYAYDGSGQRVAQSVTSGSPGTTSTTYYVGGGLEELTVSGASSTLTKYESVPGVCNVVIVGSGPSESISYVTADGLGSVSEALDGSGHVTAQQLYGPYGGVRYSNGTMPTAKGFTGQYADAASSGLDYYGARYYDPLLGQFTSADTDAKGGLNRYAYVGGNPETATDPTGHRYCTSDGSSCSNKVGGGSVGHKTGCTSDCGPAQVISTTTSTSKTNGDYSTTTTYTTVTITVQPDGTISSTSHSWSITTCDDTCHQQQDDARKGAIFHIVGGLATLGGVFVALAAGCGGIQAILTCTADMSWLGSVGLQAAHWILDGLDTLHTLSGASIGDAFAIFVRTARFAIDIAQVIFGIRDIPELLSNLRHAEEAVGDAAEIEQEVTSSSPNLDAIKEGIDKLVAFVGFGGDVLSDWQELQASEEAWAASRGNA